MRYVEYELLGVGMGCGYIIHCYSIINDKIKEGGACGWNIEFGNLIHENLMSPLPHLGLL